MVFVELIKTEAAIIRQRKDYFNKSKISYSDINNSVKILQPLQNYFYYLENIKS
jgi:hypothetical protein